ncbi:MAG TPA: GNAT family N-acetyltransferase [Bacteroidetes bacterium]|nr:GNAT family N-acetyltransferase [Bacteroidota bacterium]
MELNICQAKNKDIFQIIKLIEKWYHVFGDEVNTDRYDFDLADIEKFYSENNGIFLIATVEEIIVGTVSCIRISDDILEMKRLYVNQTYWGKGVAQRLYSEILIYANKNKYKKIILYTDNRYERSHGFHKKNGFVLTEKKEMFDADNPYISLKFELDL